VEAYLKVNGGGVASRKKAAALLAGVEPHLQTAGLGTVSEILEGDAPHRPCGCIAQAWSVAEILRAVKMVEAESTSKKVAKAK
jgi:glycogen debranching enzyme